MATGKLTAEQETALRRRIDRHLSVMDDAQRKFFYEQPDALRHVFEGGLQGYFERMRVRIPPSGLTKYGMEDAAGWKAMEDGRTLVSVMSHDIGIYYTIERDDLFKVCGVSDDPDDTEDLEDMTERRKILRAKGLAIRRLKRIWFDGDGSVNELEGLIRLKGWKTVDARTLIAWVQMHRKEIEPQETVAASAMPLLRRNGATIRLTSGVSRMRDRRGEYFGFKREDAGLDPLNRVFDSQHSFLVEVPDDRA